jgi:FkbM family methyltransferase
MPFRFREGTTDAHIALAIWHHGEYWLPERFAPADVVIDGGCHIGAFMAACLDRGARTVVGFEADPTNAAIAESHVAGDARATVKRLALWRSDVDGPTLLRHGGYGAERGMVNTGSGDVFAADGPAVQAVGLDEVLAIYGQVRLLKLDIEGAEFPVLLTCTRIRQVQTIVAEVHEFGGPEDQLAAPFALPDRLPWVGLTIGQWLIAQGYTVRMQRKAGADGLPTRYIDLHAERRD